MGEEDSDVNSGSDSNPSEDDLPPDIIAKVFSQEKRKGHSKKIKREKLAALISRTKAVPADKILKIIEKPTSTSKSRQTNNQENRSKSLIQNRVKPQQPIKYKNILKPILHLKDSIPVISTQVPMIDASTQTENGDLFKLM